MAVLNTYAVHDLNGLDIYTLHTVYEQDSGVARHERNTTYVLLLTCYTAHNVMRAYFVRMLHTSILQNFSSDLHANVKFKLSCTVRSYNSKGYWVSPMISMPRQFHYASFVWIILVICTVNKN